MRWGTGLGVYADLNSSVPCLLWGTQVVKLSSSTWILSILNAQNPWLNSFLASLPSKMSLGCWLWIFTTQLFEVSNRIWNDFASALVLQLLTTNQSRIPTIKESLCKVATSIWFTWVFSTRLVAIAFQKSRPQHALPDWDWFCFRSSTNFPPLFCLESRLHCIIQTDSLIGLGGK